MKQRFRRNIDSVRRLVKQQDVDAADEPFRERNFLLVAPRKLADGQSGIARSYIEQLD